MMLSAEFWTLLLSFAILMYVILDGFDLGLGILYPWFKGEHERELMITSIAHVWDGNETWLVFGGVILFAAFPPVYSLLLSWAYIPVICMLVALVLRGAAIEYRFKSTTSTRWWDRIFGFGSAVAAFCQGYLLGNVVVADFGFNLFSVFTGIAVMAGYALLGCCWMIIKKTPDMQIRAAMLAKRLTVVVLFAFIIVSLYSLYLNPAVWQRWFGWPQILYLSPLPALSAAVGCWLYQHCDYLLQTLGKEQELPLRLPFVLTVCLFVIGFVGLWVGMYPFLLPGQWSMYDALAPASSLSFVSYGVVLLVPLILAYTVFGYRVFSGKVVVTGH